MKSRPYCSLLPLSALALSLVASTAWAQPDQRLFSSDQPMAPFPAGTAEGSAAGGEGAATGVASVVGTGVESRAWIDLQTSGSAAVGEARPMAGEVAEAVYTRYVNSFKHPIPEYFPQSSGESSGGGSGSGGSGN